MSSTADPLASADDIGHALLACWTPPAGSEGSFVTLAFSFRRDGTLIGRPRPTVVSVVGDEEARQQFVDAAIAAVEGCAPLEFSPAFAAGVGGKVFTLPFRGADKRTTIRQRYASSPTVSGRCLTTRKALPRLPHPGAPWKREQPATV